MTASRARPRRGDGQHGRRSATVYIGALLLTALALWQIIGDGEATKFEGAALTALYVFLAVLTFYVRR